MLFSLDVVRARKGDCFLLHYSVGGKPCHMIIDGGPAGVYAAHLKPRLADIRAARGLGPGEPLPVEVVVVSHIDDDHISGILDLTRELREARANRAPLLVGVRSLWHNSFDALLATTPATSSQLGAAALEGDATISNVGFFDAAKVLSSIPQGHRLRDDATFLAWTINPAFAGQPIVASTKPRTINLGDTLKMLVIGPMSAELQELRKMHRKALKGRGRDEDAQRLLAAYVDRSVTNLSSIVLLAETNGKRMLFTGDARGDKILAGLELANAVETGGKLHVDILKVPHHGSSNDVERDLFERITADHYVFSGNGEHGNPERETIEMLLDARAGAHFIMHFTYPIADIDAGREAEWNKQRERELRLSSRPEAGKRSAKSAAAVREAWSPKQHSLAALFAERRLPDQNARIEWLDGRQPHVINLLEDWGLGTAR